jgi:hypothetical protein
MIAINAILARSGKSFLMRVVHTILEYPQVVLFTAPIRTWKGRRLQHEWYATFLPYPSPPVRSLLAGLLACQTTVDKQKGCPWGSIITVDVS